MNPFTEEGHLAPWLQRRATQLVNVYRSALHRSIRDIGRRAVIWPGLVTHPTLYRLFAGEAEWSLATLLPILASMDEDLGVQRGTMWRYLAHGQNVQSLLGWGFAICDDNATANFGDSAPSRDFLYPVADHVRSWMHVVGRLETTSASVRSYCTIPPFWLLPPDCVDARIDETTERLRAFRETAMVFDQPWMAARSYENMWWWHPVKLHWPIRSIRDGLREWAVLERQTYVKTANHRIDRRLAMPPAAIVRCVCGRPPFEHWGLSHATAFLSELIEYHIPQRHLQFWVCPLPDNLAYGIESVTSYDGDTIVLMPQGMTGWPYRVARRPGQLLPRRLEIFSRLLGGLRTGVDRPTLQTAEQTVPEYDIFDDFNQEHTLRLLRKLLDSVKKRTRRVATETIAQLAAPAPAKILSVPRAESPRIEGRRRAAEFIASLNDSIR